MRALFADEEKCTVKLTEQHVLRLLRDRHTANGNSGAGEFAFLSHVRNAAGFDASRTFDAVVLNLWPSRGLTLDIFEVKVSRSDWQRELAKPDKAEDACKLADRFWIVAPAGVVRDGELPPTWGLIEVIGDGMKLRTKAEAPALRETATLRSRFYEPLPRGFVVGMLRSCPGAIPGGKVPGPDEQAIRAAKHEGVLIGNQQGENERKRLQEELDALRSKVREFEQSAGLSLGSHWLRGGQRASAAEVGAAVRAVLAGEDMVGDTQRRLLQAQQTLRHAADELDRFVGLVPS